jgi:hypothetical protein
MSVRGRPFPKGVSGNPSGRPKADPTLRALTAAHTAEAVEGILAIARDGKIPAAVRLAAWSELLDRGHGRAAQAVNVDSTIGLPIPVIVVEMAGSKVAQRLQSEFKPPGENGD